MFSIKDMASVFEASPERIEQLLWEGGWSPADYGHDGQSPVYDRAAAEFVAEQLQHRTGLQLNLAPAKAMQAKLPHPKATEPIHSKPEIAPAVVHPYSVKMA